MGATNSKGPKITPHDRAVLDLKLQRDKVRQYQKKLQVILDREQEIAKQALVAGNKPKALTALRKKKYQESLILKTDSQLETLQGLVSSIEFSQIQQSVFHGLEQGNIVLQQIHNELGIDSVEKLLQDTLEAQAYQRELDEILATSMSVQEEEDVQIQLQQLEREFIQQNPIPQLPTPPQTEPQLPPTSDQPVKQQQQPVKQQQPLPLLPA